MEREFNDMKDLAEVKAYAETIAKSNQKWGAYVNQEQDKFFSHLNRQRNNITGLQEHLCHCHGCLIRLSLDSFLLFH